MSTSLKQVTAFSQMEAARIDEEIFKRKIIPDYINFLKTDPEVKKDKKTYISLYCRKRQRALGLRLTEEKSLMQDKIKSAQPYVPIQLWFSKYKPEIEALKAQEKEIFKDQSWSELFNSKNFFRELRGTRGVGEKTIPISVKDWLDPRYKENKNASINDLMIISNYYKKNPFNLTGEDVNAYLAEVLHDADGSANKTLSFRLNMRSWFRFISQIDEESKIGGKKGKTKGDYSKIALTVDQRVGFFNTLPKMPQARELFKKYVEVDYNGEKIGNWIAPYMVSHFALTTGTRFYGIQNAKCGDCTPKFYRQDEGGFSYFWNEIDPNDEMRYFAIVDKGGEKYGKWTKYIFPELEVTLQKYMRWLCAYMEVNIEQTDDIPLLPFSQDEMGDIKNYVRLTGQKIHLWDFSYDSQGAPIMKETQHRRTITEENYNKLKEKGEIISLLFTEDIGGRIQYTVMQKDYLPQIIGEAIGKYFYSHPIHVFRHTAAQTMLAQCDYNYKTAASVLGWNDISTLEKYYGEPPSSVMKEWLDKLKLSSTIHGKTGYEKKLESGEIEKLTDDDLKELEEEDGE